jgi:transcriptional regulator CtsR
MKVQFFVWVAFLFFSLSAFSAAPDCSKIITPKEYLYKGDFDTSSPAEKIYNFQKIRSDLKSSLINSSKGFEAKTSCLHSLYVKGIDDASTYWAERGKREKCFVPKNPKDPSNSDFKVPKTRPPECPESTWKEFKKSGQYLKNLQTELRNDLKIIADKLSDNDDDIRNCTQNPNSKKSAAAHLAKTAEEAKENLCCGKKNEPDSGAVYAVYPDISHAECVEKTVDRGSLGIKGILACTANMAKRMILGIWEGIKAMGSGVASGFQFGAKFISSPFETMKASAAEAMGAYSAVKELVTNDDARDQFMMNMASSVDGFLTSRGNVFNQCLNDYEKSQYICEVTGDILGGLADLGGVLKAIKLFRNGKAAGEIAALLNKSKSGAAVLKKMKKAEDITLKAAETTKNATQKVRKTAGRLAKNTRAIALASALLAKEAAFETKLSKALRKEKSAVVQAEKKSNGPNPNPDETTRSTDESMPPLAEENRAIQGTSPQVLNTDSPPPLIEARAEAEIKAVPTQPTSPAREVEFDSESPALSASSEKPTRPAEVQVVPTPKKPEEPVLRLTAQGPRPSPTSPQPPSPARQVGTPSPTNSPALDEQLRTAQVRTRGFEIEANRAEEVARNNPFNSTLNSEASSLRISADQAKLRELKIKREVENNNASAPSIASTNVEALNQGEHLSRRDFNDNKKQSQAGRLGITNHNLIAAQDYTVRYSTRDVATAMNKILPDSKVDYQAMQRMMAYKTDSGFIDSQALKAGQAFVDEINAKGGSDYIKSLKHLTKEESDMLNHYLDRVPEYVRQQPGKRNQPNFARSSEGAEHKAKSEAASAKAWEAEQRAGLEQTLNSKKTLELDLKLSQRSTLRLEQKAREAEEVARRNPLNSELRSDASSMRIDANQEKQKALQLEQQLKKHDEAANKYASEIERVSGERPVIPKKQEIPNTNQALANLPATKVPNRTYDSTNVEDLNQRENLSRSQFNTKQKESQSHDLGITDVNRMHAQDYTVRYTNGSVAATMGKVLPDSKVNVKDLRRMLAYKTDSGFIDSQALKAGQTFIDEINAKGGSAYIKSLKHLTKEESDMLNHYLDRVPEYVRQQTGKRDLPNLARSSEGAEHKAKSEAASAKAWESEQRSALEKSLQEKRITEIQLKSSQGSIQSLEQKAKAAEDLANRYPLNAELRDDASFLRSDLAEAKNKSLLLERTLTRHNDAAKKHADEIERITGERPVIQPTPKPSVAATPTIPTPAAVKTPPPQVIHTTNVEDLNQRDNLSRSQFNTKQKESQSHDLGITDVNRMHAQDYTVRYTNSSVTATMGKVLPDSKVNVKDLRRMLAYKTDSGFIDSQALKAGQTFIDE